MGRGLGNSEEVGKKSTKVGCNTQVHGSKARNLSVQLSLSQSNKNDVSFFFSVMFSLQQNWRRRGQSRFCLEAQTMYTHVSKCKKIKKGIFALLSIAATTGIK
jgi:hypothetical protein